MEPFDRFALLRGWRRRLNAALRAADLPPADRQRIASMPDRTQADLRAKEAALVGRKEDAP